jgi:hypothetical protein
MESVDGGSLEVSAGTINLRKTGTPTTIYEQIVANGNKSQSARFTVPVGYTGYVLDWSAAAIIATMDTKLRATTKTLTRDNNTRYLFQERIFLAIGQNYTSNLNYLKYKAGSTIKVSAIPGATAGNPKCDASFTILIVAD